jgi:preprotein translocase subunit SecG
MPTVVLVIHLMLAAALIGVVLLQRSEGGALGIGGGGGGGGGFLTGRGTANLLTRATAVLAAGFFATSIILTLMAQRSAAPGSAFDAPAASSTTTPDAPAAPVGGTPATGTDAPAPGAPARGGVLDRLQGGAPKGPAVPQTR